MPSRISTPAGLLQRKTCSSRSTIFFDLPTCSHLPDPVGDFVVRLRDSARAIRQKKTPFRSSMDQKDVIVLQPAGLRTPLSSSQRVAGSLYQSPTPLSSTSFGSQALTRLC